MKNYLFIGAIAISAVFAGAFILLKNDQKSPTNQTSSQGTAASAEFSAVPVNTELLIRPHSPLLGSASAKVTIVEFLDPECEACAAMHPITKQILSEFPGQITFVVRYMPFHGNSKYVANILEGARAQGKYWEAMDLLFESQHKWGSHDRPDVSIIPEILAPLKLDIKKIVADAKAGKYDELINKDLEDGRAIGVNRTPTYFVNGNQLYEIGYSALKNEVQLHLNK